MPTTPKPPEFLFVSVSNLLIIVGQMDESEMVSREEENIRKVPDPGAQKWAGAVW